MQSLTNCLPWSGNTLVTIDVRDPSRPTPLGLVRAGGLRISVSGDVACLTGRGAAGLSVIDVSDPAHPIFAGTLEMPSGAKRVRVSGDLAYVADGEAGIQIVDVADPGTPGIIGSIVLPGLVGATNPVNHILTDFLQSGGCTSSVNGSMWSTARAFA